MATQTQSVTVSAEQQTAIDASLDKITNVAANAEQVKSAVGEAKAAIKSILGGKIPEDTTEKDQAAREAKAKEREKAEHTGRGR